MSSMKVMRRPQGCGLFTISLSSRTLEDKFKLLRRHVGVCVCVCGWLQQPPGSPGDLLLDGLRVGLSKQVEHGAAEVMGVAVGVAQLVGNGIQEEVTPCRARTRGGGQSLDTHRQKAARAAAF